MQGLPALANMSELENSASQKMGHPHGFPARAVVLVTCKAGHAYSGRLKRYCPLPRALQICVSSSWLVLGSGSMAGTEECKVKAVPEFQLFVLALFASMRAFLLVPWMHPWLSSRSHMHVARS